MSRVAQCSGGWLTRDTVDFELPPTLELWAVAFGSRFDVARDGVTIIFSYPPTPGFRADGEGAGIAFAVVDGQIEVVDVGCDPGPDRLVPNSARPNDPDGLDFLIVPADERG